MAMNIDQQLDAGRNAVQHGRSRVVDARSARRSRHHPIKAWYAGSATAGGPSATTRPASSTTTRS